MCATFRANENDDTLVAMIAPSVANADETLVDGSASLPWSGCIGLGVCWLRQLNNQQRYTDGVRLEFSEPGEPSVIRPCIFIGLLDVPKFVLDRLKLRL